MGRKKSSGKVNDLYLIPELEDGEFENQTLKSFSKEIIEKLIKTKELQYITKLSSIRTIYKEDIFWKQIIDWRIREFYFRADNNPEALKDIENIQASICKGFKKVIKSFKPTKQGRPSKSINLDDDLDIVEEYITLERRIRNEFGTPDMTRRREEGLAEYLIKHEVLGKKINLSENKMKTLAKKSPFEIAIYLLAESLRVGTRKIKTLIADTNYTDEGAFIFELPDGKKRRVSYEVFDKALLKIEIEATKTNQILSKKDKIKKLSRKLKIPEELIAECSDAGVNFDVFYKSNQPHKNRPTPEEDLILKLANGKKVRVSYLLFRKYSYKAIIEAINEAIKKKHTLSSLTRKLARQSKIPHKSIVKYFETEDNVDYSSRSIKPNKHR